MPPAIVAREALTRFRDRPEDGNVLSEVSQVLRRYMSATLHFAPGELTTAEFCSELERSQKITPELKRGISEFLRACDDRKFSPAVLAPPLNAAERALQMITEKEEHTQEAAENERRV